MKAGRRTLKKEKTRERECSRTHQIEAQDVDNTCEKAKYRE
jgi:hypothetical protein